MRVLSVTHGPSVGGGVFDELVEREGHRLERWSVPLGAHHEQPDAYDAVLVFGGAMHPDADEGHPWLPGEADFLRRLYGLQRPADEAVEIPAEGTVRAFDAQRLLRLFELLRHLVDGLEAFDRIGSIDR